MRSEILFGDIAKFSNGKTSPDRDDNAKYNVFGSNGIIGKSNLSNTEKETIIIGRVGSYCGSVYYSKDKCWVTDNAIKCEAKNDNIPSFIYYQASKLNLNNFRVGSGQPLLNQGILNSLKINYFAPNTQKKIAHILSTLDDKIELNRKMNQTLEEMAQAIFKSWFVDFDPVHVKMACANEEELQQAAKELGISKEILDLFPNEFEESELGMIPKGWEVKPLYETAEYINGASFKENDFSKNSTGLPIIKIVELKNGISSATRYSDNHYPDKYRIKNGDIVYSWSGSPETSLDLFKWFGGDGWLNQHIFKLNFESKEQMHHTYYLLKLIKPLLIETAKQKQTTGLGHITIADMKRIKIPYPNHSILELFSKTIEPFFQQSSILLQETQTLQKTRDTLLPKLLSGELDVSELEF